MTIATINGFTLTHAALNATQGISPIERLILATLASFSNFLSECWPSNQTLADRTGLHERTVRRQLESLQAKGLIERHSRGQGRAMLTRLLITPKGKTPDIVPPTPDIVPPPYEPIRNINQIPAVLEPATLEPQHQQATDTANAAIVVFTENEQPPQAITKEMPDVFATDSMVTVSEVTGCHLQAGMPVEARTAPQEPSKEVPDTDPLADVPATSGQAVEADPLADVPATLLADLGEVRKAKKRAPKPTKIEAALWWTEAQKAGWTMQQVITTMILHGWARFQADWVQHVPPQTAPSASPQVWKPEPHTPASPEVVAAAKAKLAELRAQILADSARRREQTLARMRQ